MTSSGSGNTSSGSELVYCPFTHTSLTNTCHVAKPRFNEYEMIFCHSAHGAGGRTTKSLRKDEYRER